MQFYKFKCLAGSDDRLRTYEDEKEEQDRNREFAAAVEEFNCSAPGGACCFLSRIKETTLTGGVILRRAGSPEQTAQALLERLGFQPRELETEEITLRMLRNLARTAYHEDLIDSDDMLYERFGLDPLINRRPPFVDYTESMLPALLKTKKTLLAETRKLLCGDTFAPELTRIFSGGKPRLTCGHPVHYTVDTDDADAARQMLTALLQALYAKGRLSGRKYVTVNADANDRLSEEQCEALYGMCEGGAVALRLWEPAFEDEEYTGNETETIETLCGFARRYRHKTLTVFLLPRASERLKKQIREELGDISLVELREDLADADRSRAYLKQLAKETGVRMDPALVEKVQPEKQYLPDELRKLFDEWFNEKLKTGVYPQYGAFASCRKEVAKAAPKGSAWDDLQEMIGLSEAKSVIGKALDYYKLQRIYKDRGVKQDRPAMHMVFTGNPGTAKTSAARLFARIMKENGLLSKGHLVEVGRSDLVARYVGWTAKTVQEKFKAAMGGALFIDEAYSLVDDRGGSFGDEAINTIVQEMENRREDLVVIFAGYPDEMEKFLDKNPGLRSRIAFHVPFADYSAEELSDIAKLIGKQKGIVFSDDALEKLRAVFEAARLQPDFGNGRYARNAVEQAKMNMASRLLTTDLAAVTKETLTTIEEADIDLPTVKKAVRTNVIGFCA